MTGIFKDWRANSEQVLKRVEAVDLFKFFVLFLMIQGHLFRAYLLPSIRMTRAWGLHEVFHGMVAPGFLFSAGFSAFLSYYKKRKQYSLFQPVFWRRLMRIGFVVWAGYWIHLPFLSLRKVFQGIRGGTVNEFLKADILQCIGVALLLFMLLSALLKNEKILVLASAAVSLAFFLLPPLAKDIQLPLGWKAYFSYQISNFPLFPWAGYLFAGIVTAFLFITIRSDLFFRILFGLGVLFFPWVFFTLGTRTSYYKLELTLTGNLNKFAGVLLMLVLANFLTYRFRNRFVELLKKAGKESLFVYVFHLFIIFGSIFGRGLKTRFANRLNVMEALLLFLILQAFVFASSWGYAWIKENRPRVWKISFYLFWLGFFAFILWRKY